jgi:mRNA-degrading endonuclease RelE of RelBE toxin-antitoxin system
MPPAYTLVYEQGYLDDLEQIDPFDIPWIRDSLLQLDYQAEQATRNRRPLRSPVSWCPEATWQLRVRAYRVLYRIQDGVVTVLRLRFKGSAATEEMGP